MEGRRRRRWLAANQRGALLAVGVVGEQERGHQRVAVTLDRGCRRRRKGTQRGTTKKSVHRFQVVEVEIQPGASALAATLAGGSVSSACVSRPSSLHEVTSKSGRSRSLRLPLPPPPPPSASPRSPKRSSSSSARSAYSAGGWCWSSGWSARSCGR